MILKIITQIFLKCKNDNINTVSNQLTYKILLSLFPFVIFLMTLIAYFNLDINILLMKVSNMIPIQAMGIVNLFITEVVTKKNIQLLSSSLLISIFSASSGFSSIIKCINKIYCQHDSRNFLVIRIISIFCVIFFALSLILCIILIVFGNKIFSSLSIYSPISIIFRYFTSIFLLTFFSALIYKISISRKINFLSLLPGAMFCACGWIVLSYAFNFYVNNFSRYSTFYGSVGSIFILMLWINLLINVLLVGIEINYWLDRDGDETHEHQSHSNR